mgnify:CR=1 FL=1
MLQLILAIAGVYMLIAGKVPNWVLGKKGCEIVGTNARIIGLVLVLPLPFSFGVGLVLGVLFGEVAVSYGFVIDIVVLIVELIIAFILIRQFRTPVSSQADATSSS